MGVGGKPGAARARTVECLFFCLFVCLRSRMLGRAEAEGARIRSAALNLHDTAKHLIHSVPRTLFEKVQCSAAAAAFVGVNESGRTFASPSH